MYGKFLVEGDKLVREVLLSSFKVDAVFKLNDWNHTLTDEKIELNIVTEEELRKISTHESPNQVLAVVQIPDLGSTTPVKLLEDGLYLACDSLNDPGNAGSIIRIADWFGIRQIFFSENSVEIYNPKVVNAAKGSLLRVKCSYVNLEELFTMNHHLKVYGTFMNGENIYQSTLQQSAFILIGNEANGISEALMPFVREKISIPSFGSAESLNAAVATGIVVSEFARRIGKT